MYYSLGFSHKALPQSYVGADLYVRPIVHSSILRGKCPSPQPSVGADLRVSPIVIQGR